MNEDIWIYELSERLLIFEKNPRHPRKFSLTLTFTLSSKIFDYSNRINWYREKEKEKIPNI